MLLEKSPSNVVSWAERRKNWRAVGCLCCWYWAKWSGGESEKWQAPAFCQIRRLMKILMFFSLFCWWFFTDSDPAKVHHHCSLNPPFGGRFLSSWKSTAGMLMSWCRFLQVKHRCVFVYGGFLKWWVYPTTMGFPIKNHHFWFFVGASPFKETPIWYPRGWHVTRLWFWFEWYLVLCKSPSSSWNYSSINSWCSIYPSTGTS